MGNQIFKSCLESSADFDSAGMESVKTIASKNIASNQSMSLRESSIGSLHQVKDEHEAELILAGKKDDMNNPELFSVLGEYFANSLQTLAFCNTLDNCLKPVLDRQLSIVVALQHFENETKEKGFEEEMNQKTLEELKNFTDLVNKFNDEFVRIFQETFQKQHEMLKRLDVRHEKLKKRERSTKTWRIVTKVLFVTTLVGVLIMSVVTVAIGAPAVLSPLLGALSFPIDYMGKWINTYWKSYETKLTGEFKLVDSMHRGSCIADEDLDNIRMLVNKLETEIKSVSHNAGEEDAVKFVTEQIKKGLSSFSECIEDLTNQTASCHNKIMDARTVILQQIKNIHTCNSL